MVWTEFPLLFQNGDFVAVDKAAGISVHNNEDPQNLIGVLQKQLGSEKLYPVHRLDKETSGVQIIALNPKAAKALAEEFEKRSVKKVYLGLLRGALKIEQGLWNHPLTDKGEGRRNPAGAPKERVPCETQFRVLKKSDYFTFCEFNLITGRQHQIRKHAAVANHALVGDPRYGDERYNKKISGIYKTSRLFLHCSRLEIADQVLESPTPEGFIL
jgi:tRNA pseudouridine65 synthase